MEYHYLCGRRTEAGTVATISQLLVLYRDAQQHVWAAKGVENDSILGSDDDLSDQ